MSIDLRLRLLLMWLASDCEWFLVHIVHLQPQNTESIYPQLQMQKQSMWRCIIFCIYYLLHSQVYIDILLITHKTNKRNPSWNFCKANKPSSHTSNHTQNPPNVNLAQIAIFAKLPNRHQPQSIKWIKILILANPKIMQLSFNFSSSGLSIAIRVTHFVLRCIFGFGASVGCRFWGCPFGCVSICRSGEVGGPI